MAYVDQEKKAAIAAALKPVIPAGWKTSLSVRNHSTIVLTISAAPVDLLAEMQRLSDQRAFWRGDECFNLEGHARANPYHYDKEFDDSLPVMTAIFAALNLGNYNNDDVQSDYFDRGHYVDVEIGRWNKPFQYLAPVEEAA